jgi:hypothetical protein
MTAEIKEKFLAMLRPGEVLLEVAAKMAGMAPITLHKRIKAGEVTARRLASGKFATFAVIPESIKQKEVKLEIEADEVSTPQVALLLDMTHDSIAGLCRRGTLKARKARFAGGFIWVLKRADVLAYKATISRADGEVDTGEACRIAKVSQTLVSRWANRGYFKARQAQVNKRCAWLINKEDLVRFLSDRRNKDMVGRCQAIHANRGIRKNASKPVSEQGEPDPSDDQQKEIAKRTREAKAEKIRALEAKPEKPKPKPMTPVEKYIKQWKRMRRDERAKCGR